MDKIIKSVTDPVQGYGKGAEVIRQLFPEHRRLPVRHQYPPVSIVDDGHPMGLGNPKILSAIFSHLELLDLISLRRVNLRWNFVACEYLRQNLGPCRIPPSRMKSFIKLMRSSCCNPFSSYAIRVENTNDSVLLNCISDFKLDIVSLRMKFVGNEIPALLGLLHKLPNLSYLHVIRLPEQVSYLSRSHSSDDFSKFRNQQLSNLKSVTLEKENLGMPFAHSYDKYIINIINSSPNLTHLKFINWGTTLSHIFTSCRIVNPKIFNGWDPNILNEDQMLLFECGLHLKSVKLLISNENQNQALLTHWLRTQSPNLRSLSVKYHDDNTRPEAFPTFCKLANVLTFYLHRWKGPVDFSSLGKTFPTLNTLSLSAVTLEDLSLLGNGVIGSTDVCLTLKVLILMPLDSCVNAPALKKLAHYFPNISQLFVQLSGNDSAHVIYKEWPKLQVLFLDFKENASDEALTGIPEESFEIRKTLECGCIHVNYLANTTQPRSTAIGDLTKLLILVIRCGEGLTSFSILKGICSLTQLQRLWLLPNPNEEFYYPWCLKAIADGLKNLEHLVIGKEVNYSKESLDYTLDKLPFLLLQRK